MSQPGSNELLKVSGSPLQNSRSPLQDLQSPLQDLRSRKKAGSLSTSCLLLTAYSLLSTGLRSCFPAPDVFELFCCQRIDGQAQRSKFQAGDFGIDFLRQQVDAGL